MSTHLIPLQAIERAVAVVAPFVVRTPLIRVHFLEELAPKVRVFLKCEHLQRSGSFKDRGACYAVACLSAEQKAAGVVTRSSGNFGQALALAGSRNGVKVTVVMPTNAPKIKVESTRKWGANVVLVGTTHREGLAEAQRLRAEHGYVFVPPFDDTNVMTGQGTLGLECCAQLPTMTRFYAPLGGGGLMGGAASAIKHGLPQVRVIAAEPAGADDFARSLASGSRQTLERTDSIADGLLAPAVGELCWPVLCEAVDGVAVVTDEEIASAMRLLFERCGMIVEPSAAVALAGLIWDIKGGRVLRGDVVCVVSGCNVDRARFDALLGAR